MCLHAEVSSYSMSNTSDKSIQRFDSVIGTNDSCAQRAKFGMVTKEDELTRFGCAVFKHQLAYGG